MDFSLGFMDLWAVNLDGLLKLELNQRELFLSDRGERPIQMPLSDQKALRELDKKKE